MTATKAVDVVWPSPSRSAVSSTAMISPRRFKAPRTGRGAVGIGNNLGSPTTACSAGSSTEYISSATGRSNARTTGVRRLARGHGLSSVVELSGEVDERCCRERDLLRRSRHLPAGVRELLHRLDDLRGCRTLLLGRDAN